MHYRVAIQVDPSLTWQWKSTVLSSLNTLLQVLRLYRSLPQDRLQVFSSSSREGLEEQLVQENQGHLSPSVTAAHFLQERLIHSPEVGGGTLQRERRVCQEMASMGIATPSLVNESCTGAHALDMPGRCPPQLCPSSFDAASSCLDEASCQDTAWGIAAIDRICRQ